MAATANSFVWYELMTSDLTAAETFYKGVVGWATQDAGMPEPYTMVLAGSSAIGGLMTIPEEARKMGAPPCWVGYIGVPDVDAAAARVQAAGGALHRAPDDIPGVGRFAVVADPQGAGFMLFKGNMDEAPPAPPPGTAGTVGWHELHAGDGASAWDFYAGQFGWTKDSAMDMGPMGLYQLFCTGGEAVGGMMTKVPEMPVAAWLYYFNVDAIDAAAQRVTSAGGKVVNGPMEVPGGQWIINATDPQGAMFALVAPKR